MRRRADANTRTRVVDEQTSEKRMSGLLVEAARDDSVGVQHTEVLEVAQVLVTLEG